MDLGFIYLFTPSSGMTAFEKEKKNTETAVLVSQSLFNGCAKLRFLSPKLNIYLVFLHFLFRHYLV